MNNATEVTVSGRGLAWMVWAIHDGSDRMAFDTSKIYATEEGAVRAARRLNRIRAFHNLDYRYVAVLVETFALKAVV